MGRPVSNKTERRGGGEGGGRTVGAEGRVGRVDFNESDNDMMHDVFFSPKVRLYCFYVCIQYLIIYCMYDMIPYHLIIIIMLELKKSVHNTPDED
jgi:hypothetical protein